MLIFALNSTMGALDIALVSGGDVIAELRDESPRGQDARLPGMVNQIFETQGLSFGQIDRLAVVTGPGSFTGIRIGVAYMRGLALGLGVPCIGISSLEAGLSPRSKGAVVCAMAAKKRPPDKSWWVQRFLDGIAIDDPSERSERELTEYISDDCTVFMTGELSGIEKKIHPFRPSAALAAIRAIGANEEMHQPVPQYARAPDAALPTV